MTETDITEDGITENDAPDDQPSEALDNFVDAPPAKIKRGVGLGAVLPLFLLAGLGGAVGGWALTQYVMPNYIALPQAQANAADTPKVNLGPLTTRIETLEKKLTAQSSEISFLSSEVKSGSGRVTVGGVDEAFDITPLMNRIGDLEMRLAAAEASASGDVSPVTNAGGSAVTAPTYLKAVEDRLVTLEKSLFEGLGATSERPVSSDLPTALLSAKDYDDDISSLELRLSKLETDVEQARALAAEPTVVRETVLLPPFPREALLEAMTAPREQQAQSWLDKTLKKHISVRNPQEVAKAEETLDRVEALTDSGDYAAALKLIEAMPSDVRSVANDWTRALKAEIETRP